MKLVIPTHLREKIPGDFAYPLWPTKISELLASTPQRGDSELVFRWRDEFRESRWRKRIEQRGTLSLFTAHYTPDYSPYFPKWRFTVYSVPRAYLSAAQELLLGDAFDELVSTLTETGLTPAVPVDLTVSMNLSDCLHDQPQPNLATRSIPDKHALHDPIHGQAA